MSRGAEPRAAELRVGFELRAAELGVAELRRVLALLILQLLPLDPGGHRKAWHRLPVDAFASSCMRSLELPVSVAEPGAAVLRVVGELLAAELGVAEQCSVAEPGAAELGIAEQ